MTSTRLLFVLVEYIKHPSRQENKFTSELRPETFRSDRLYPTFMRTCILVFLDFGLFDRFFGFRRNHVVLLYIQNTHLGLLLFWIIRTRRMICDESALKFFESPMIVQIFKIFKNSCAHVYLYYFISRLSKIFELKEK